MTSTSHQERLRSSRKRLARSRRSSASTAGVMPRLWPVVDTDPDAVSGGGRRDTVDTARRCRTAPSPRGPPVLPLRETNDADARWPGVPPPPPPPPPVPRAAVRAGSESSPASTATAHGSHTRTALALGLKGSTRREREQTSQKTPPHLPGGQPTRAQHAASAQTHMDPSANKTPTAERRSAHSPERHVATPAPHGPDTHTRTGGSGASGTGTAPAGWGSGTRRTRRWRSRGPTCAGWCCCGWRAWAQRRGWPRLRPRPQFAPGRT